MAANASLILLKIRLRKTIAGDLSGLEKGDSTTLSLLGKEQFLEEPMGTDPGRKA